MGQMCDMCDMCASCDVAMMARCMWGMLVGAVSNLMPA
jgi:hypothetical protein